MGVVKKNNFEKGFAHFFYIKSYIELYSEKNELTIINAQKASDIYLKVKDTAEYLNARYNVAYALNDMDKLNESIAANADIKFSKSKNFRYQIGKFNQCLGNNYYTINNLKKSLFHYNLAVSNYRQSNVNGDLMILGCYSEIAQIYQSTKQLDKALDFIKTAIKLMLNETGNNIQSPRLYIILSSIYFDQGDYKNSLKNLNISINKSNSTYNDSL